MPTFLVLLVIIAVFILIVRNEIKKRKNGCSCGCESCSMKDSCHRK
ncbi:MAG: FeoB-associated Cys-rich membrane protein [Clostridia bacterium]|nr:FeoB-associated Cys-rich membrane protein [Clostridia bacterium]